MPPTTSKCCENRCAGIRADTGVEVKHPFVRKPLTDNASRMLEDGSYYAIVVDADTGGDAEIVVDLTIIGGAHKGDVVTDRAVGTDRDPVALLGLPAPLVATNSQPTFTFDE